MEEVLYYLSVFGAGVCVGILGCMATVQMSRTSAICSLDSNSWFGPKRLYWSKQYIIYTITYPSLSIYTSMFDTIRTVCDKYNNEHILQFTPVYLKEECVVSPSNRRVFQVGLETSYLMSPLSDGPITMLDKSIFTVTNIRLL